MEYNTIQYILFQATRPISSKMMMIVMMIMMIITIIAAVSLDTALQLGAHS